MKKITLYLCLLLAASASQGEITKAQFIGNDATGLTQLVKDGKTTAVELTTIAYQILEEENPKLNAIIFTRKSEALAEAQKLDEKIAAGDKDTLDKPLLGVPTVIKGMDRLKGMPDGTGFVALQDKRPSRRMSRVAKEYQDKGMIIIGASSFPEFGMRNVTLSNLYGITNNPFDLTRNPGGSSGGSAAAVASGMAPIASASDMGGSTRIPAGWTGLIGLKTTGASSKFALTKTADDTRTMFLTSKDRNIKKFDKSSLVDKDTYGNKTSFTNKKFKYTLQSPMGTPVSEDAKAAVIKTVRFLKSQGFETEEIKWPVDGRIMLEEYTYKMLGSGRLIDYLLKRKKNVDKNTMDPLNYGIWQFAKKFKKELNADLEQRKNNKEYKDLLAKLKALHEDGTVFITPTNATVAPKNPSKNDIYNGIIDSKVKNILLNMENTKLSYEELIKVFLTQWEPMLKNTPFTMMFNMSGDPAISLPIHMTDKGLPVGVMLSVAAGDDQKLIQLARYFEMKDMFEMKDELVSEKDNTEGSLNRYSRYLVTPMLLYGFERELKEKYRLATPDRKADFDNMMKFTQRLYNTGDCKLDRKKYNNSGAVTDKDGECELSSNKEKALEYARILEEIFVKLNGNLVKYKVYAEDYYTDKSILNMMRGDGFSASIAKSTNKSISSSNNPEFSIAYGKSFNNFTFYGFTEVDAHNKAVGIAAEYNDNLYSFFRYRKRDKLSQQIDNYDVLVGYKNSFSVNNNTTIEPSVNVLVSYEEQHNITDTVYIGSNVLTDINLKARLSYGKDVTFYVEPNIDYIHNTKTIYKSDEKGNQLDVSNDGWDYSANIGIEKIDDKIGYGVNVNFGDKEHRVSTFFKYDF